MKMVTARIIFSIFAAASISTAAQAIQVKVPTVSVPHVKVPNVATPKVNAHVATPKVNVTAAKVNAATGQTGQTRQMKLQMGMDRRSKMLNTLSNIEKKDSDTASGIVGNLK